MILYVQPIFGQQRLHVIYQIGLGSLLLLLVIYRDLLFGVIVSVDFEIVQELAQRENKVLCDFQSVVVHCLWDDKDGGTGTGLT